MNKMQGYYSLLQYSEYPERIEFVNIGIVLFAESDPRVLIKFSKSARRVERIFGVSLGQHFRLLKESIENRLESEFSSPWHRNKVERFISMRSGKIRLSPLKSVLVKDPQADLDALFERLVGDEQSAARGPQAKTILKRHFQSAGVVNLLERPEPIELLEGVSINASYAYQNGSYNLINAVSLREDPDHAFANASKHAVEGQLLSEKFKDEPKRLIIVGDLAGQRRNFANAVSKIMKEHDVSFFSIDNIDPLVEDIRKTVKAN